VHRWLGSQGSDRFAGSSVWFDRGFVTYSNASKYEMLGVRQELIEAEGAVSEAVVREMVRGAIANSAADLALAVSGIAGPGGGTPDKPVGTVWFAWGQSNIALVTRLVRFEGDRDRVRRQAVLTALLGAVDLLEK